MSPGSSSFSEWVREAAKGLPGPVEGILRHSHSGALFEPHARLSYSQEGEDLLLARLFDGQESGFYVDIGAHHPTRYSNTHLLYTRGWTGINLDPTPGAMRLFEKKRPRDTNLEIAIASKPGTIVLLQFEESALNTTSQSVGSQRESEGSSLMRQTHVEAKRLADVLDEHVPSNVSKIDLFSVDTEGNDLDVLLSNDWSRFRPHVLVIEILGLSVSDISLTEEFGYLRGLGYDLYAKLVNSVILVDAT